MRLFLNLPATWERKEAPGDRFLALLPGAGQPEAIITFGPLTIRPDEPRSYIEQTMRSDLPPGTRINVVRRVDHESGAGWPMHLIESELRGAPDEVVECRLYAFYTFLEHTAVAVVRTATQERFAAHGPELLAILESGRPDWRGEPLCLADVWDLETQPEVKTRAMKDTPPMRNDGALQESLAQVDAALAAGPTAADHLRRGDILRDLQRPGDALNAYQAALGLTPSSVLAHYLAGVALGELGRHGEAIAEWEAVLKLDPGHIDSHYNIAQARFNQGQFELALGGFAAVRELDPADFQCFRKLIQCLYALGRDDEGELARGAFREQWATTGDPRARMMTEYVFDQFPGPGFRVHAIETLRPRDPAFYTVLAFRAVDSADHALPAVVVVETSDQAKKAGTPLVLGVMSGPQYKTIGAAHTMPPYAELKQTVLGLLGEALKKKPEPGR